jgi:hypothetical protein
VDDGWARLAGPVATADERAVPLMGRAIHGVLTHGADTPKHLERALAVDGDLVLAHLVRGFGLRLLARRDLEPEIRGIIARAEATLGDGPGGPASGCSPRPCGSGRTAARPPPPRRWIAASPVTRTTSWPSRSPTPAAS